MTRFSVVLNKYGQTAVLKDGVGEKSIKVMITPESQGYSMGLKEEPGEMGRADTSKYMCFLPGETDLNWDAKTYLTAGGKSYRILNASLFNIGGKPSHWECVMKEAEEGFVI